MDMMKVNRCYSLWGLKGLKRKVDSTGKVKLQRANVLLELGDLKNVDDVHACHILNLFALSFYRRLCESQPSVRQC